MNNEEWVVQYLRELADCLEKGEVAYRGHEITRESDDWLAQSGRVKKIFNGRQTFTIETMNGDVAQRERDELKKFLEGER